MSSRKKRSRLSRLSSAWALVDRAKAYLSNKGQGKGDLPRPASKSPSPTAGRPVRLRPPRPSTTAPLSAAAPQITGVVRRDTVAAFDAFQAESQRPFR